MKPEEQERLALIGELLALARPLEGLADDIAKLGWDFDGKGAELRSEHLRSVLSRYRDGALSAEEVERWANLIEGREDVCVQEVSQSQVGDVLCELANPLMTRPLSRVRVDELLAMLD